MEGEERKSDSGKNSEKPVKTEEVTATRSVSAEAAPAADVPGSLPQRMAALDAVASLVDVSRDRWPGEALKASIKRFGRMPRGGWECLHRKYCGQFASRLSLGEFKKRANAQSSAMAVLLARGRNSLRSPLNASKLLTLFSTRKQCARPRSIWTLSEGMTY